MARISEAAAFGKGDKQVSCSYLAPRFEIVGRTSLGRLVASTADFADQNCICRKTLVSSVDCLFPVEKVALVLIRKTVDWETCQTRPRKALAQYTVLERDDTVVERSLVAVCRAAGLCQDTGALQPGVEARGIAVVVDVDVAAQRSPTTEIQSDLGVEQVQSKGPGCDLADFDSAATAHYSTRMPTVLF